MAANNQPVRKFLSFCTYLFTAVLFFGVGGLAFWFYQQKISPPLIDSVVELKPTSNSTPIPTVMPTVITTPGISDEQLIKQALADRHSKTVGETEMSINHNTGTHAQGVVRFTGEISGAWWLAYNDGSGWLIVDAGNGTISCAVIAPYNFPTSLVPECYDEATSTLIVR